MKKCIALILSFSIFFVVGISSVNAEETTFSINSHNNMSLLVSDVSESFKTSIENMGIEMDHLSSVQIVPLEQNKEKQAGNVLVITNEDGDIVKKDVLLLIDQDGTAGLSATTIARAIGSSDATFPPASWDDRLLIHATGVYNQFTNGFDSNFYQPIGTYFSYEKYKSCNVSNIMIDFITEGSDYTYPGFESLGRSVGHVINVSQNNPAVGATYSKNDPYRSDRVIYTGGGSLNLGLAITFTMTIDGTTTGYTVKM